MLYIVTQDKNSNGRNTVAIPNRFRRPIALSLFAMPSPTGRDTKCPCRRSRCLRAGVSPRLYPFRARAMRYLGYCRCIRLRRIRRRFCRCRPPRRFRGSMSRVSRNVWFRTWRGYFFFSCTAAELSATTMFLSTRRVTLLSTSMRRVVSLISLTVP